MAPNSGQEFKEWTRVQARIGLIVPSLNVTIEPELSAMAPKGVTVHATRLLMRGGPQALWEMAAETEKAAELLATAGVHIIVYACTSGSMIGGKGWDQELIKRIEAISNTTATTTATAAVAALKQLGVNCVAIGTPYGEESNRKLESFLAAHGITVAHMEGLALSQTGELRNTGPEVAYSLAKKVNRDEAQAVFLSCTNFRTIAAIAPLEQELGKPVISSNTATLWDALRRLKIKEPVLGYGQIFHKI